jgi:hypothetical protein
MGNAGSIGCEPGIDRSSWAGNLAEAAGLHRAASMVSVTVANAWWRDVQMRGAEAFGSRDEIEVLVREPHLRIEQRQVDVLCTTGRVPLLQARRVWPSLRASRT